MKAALQLRQSQQLTLTPQLQQAIRLLQLSTLEIHQETTRLLDENPFLEREDDAVAIYAPTAGTTMSPSLPEETAEADHASTDEWDAPGYASTYLSTDAEDDYSSELPSGQPTLREHLLRQLGVSPLDEHDKRIVALLIDALDEQAYLTQPLEEIAAMLPPELGITLDDLETALVQLQHLDEPGIGARNLSECLTLQLLALPEDLPGRALALAIVRSHLDLLAARDFTRLKKLLRCSDAELRAAQELIVHLRPRPGAAYEQRVADYVVPDVIVEKTAGQWRAHLNPEAMPRLRVNQVYASILQQRGDKNAQQLASQLQEARWYIKNLRQRFDTILRVSQAIVDRQRKFFEHGDIAMRPLVLREIAEQLDLHESTISRVTTQKYMLTPRGIYELKYFFGSGLATDSGGACSSTAIRALIKQLISEENRQQPLTDSRLSEILAQQGIHVARRTVAKYREAMNILPVNLRKSL